MRGSVTRGGWVRKSSSQRCAEFMRDLETELKTGGGLPDASDQIVNLKPLEVGSCNHKACSDEECVDIMRLRTLPQSGHHVTMKHLHDSGECEDILESYVVRGEDDWLTRSSMLAAGLST